ncbi:MAG: TIGR03621 family F420-dependent LLM class oxidoreductase [Actinobacteria bacterium]|nr:TIGR03621 family F420-dependent LLM class oxidoreductase [Actinomycetota bacterium]
MAKQRPFRFGAKAKVANNGKEWADIARQAEDLGYVSLQIDDHYTKQLAPIPAMMAAACATSTLKVGTLVAGNDFRNPVVFAKEAATIDVLSGGRFMLGLGAGWMKEDYTITGIEQDDAMTRIHRMEEAIDVMRGLWGAGPFSHAGRFYSVSEIDAWPKPVSGIPIIVGGGGEKLLAMAGRKADIVGINPKIVGRSINPRSMATAAADVVDEKIRYVKAGAGDRFDEIELSLQVFVTVVTNDPQGVAEKYAPAFGLPPEVVLTAPYFQIGSVEQIKENLIALRERWGINYIAFQQDATAAMEPVVAELSGQ